MEGRPPDGAVTTTVATAATAASARSLAPSARPLDSVASLEALDDKALQDRVTGAGYTLYQSLPPYSDDHLSSTAATYYKNLQPVAVTRYRFKDQGYLDAYVSMVCKKEMLCLLGGKTLVSVWSEDPVARAAVRTAVGSGVAGAVHKP